MQPTLGEELRIFVFEGSRLEIKNEVDGWFSGHGKVFEVVDIQYNYQAPEQNYNPEQGVTWEAGSHGVLITARQLAANDPQHTAASSSGRDEREHQCTAACVTYGEAGVTHAN